jgi:oligopeptide/dipeptide ABC transporter ATP-binding protein
VLPDTRSAPRHPYTQALMQANFAPDPSRRRRIEPLSGEIPSPFALPPGCAFAARCPRVSDRCRRESPMLTGTTDHPVACFHPL